MLPQWKSQITHHEDKSKNVKIKEFTLYKSGIPWPRKRWLVHWGRINHSQAREFLWPEPLWKLLENIK